VHELQVAQPQRVGRVEILDAALEEVCALRGEHDAGLAGDARIHVCGRQHRLQFVLRHVRLHPLQGSVEEAREVARRGHARLLDPGASGADPAPVGDQLPRDQGDAVAAHVLRKPRLAALSGDHAVLAVHVGDRHPPLLRTHRVWHRRDERDGGPKHASAVHARFGAGGDHGLPAGA
jgi:hypothetical protein